MTVIVQAISHATRDWRGRFLALLFLCFMLLSVGTHENQFIYATLEQLSDAYLQVGVFVAFTLLLFGWLEDRYGVDVASLADKSKPHEILIAAALGVMPGCGGAIMIVTYYIHGRLSYAALVTTLIATMGDAAFLILAVKPLSGLLIMAISFTVAVITGLVIVYTRFNRFYTGNKTTAKPMTNIKRAFDGLPDIIRKLWFLILIPGIIFGIGDLFVIEWATIHTLVEFAHFYVGVIGCILCLLLWCYYGGTPLHTYHLSRSGQTAINLMANSLPKNESKNTNLQSRVINDTNFVMFWVVAGYLLFFIVENQFSVNLYKISEQSIMLMPLLAILIGFLPGCGPQIIVASMYLQGIIPFSALLGNAMNNDGDALFPAIALAPKTAISATILTAIPSLICAYLYAFLIEGLW